MVKGIEADRASLVPSRKVVHTFSGFWRVHCAVILDQSLVAASCEVARRNVVSGCLGRQYPQMSSIIRAGTARLTKAKRVEGLESHGGT